MPYLISMEQEQYARNRQSIKAIDTFYGYNHGEKIGDGEWYDERNLTAEEYPMFASRRPRGLVEKLFSPRGIAGKTKLAWIDGNRLYYGGEDTGLWLNNKLPKRMVTMGGYLLVWPDKVYVNTENPEDKGSLEAAYETSGVKLEICRQGGDVYGVPVLADSAPENPQNGDLWIDTSKDTRALYIWSDAQKQWNNVATVYVKVTAAGIADSFSVYDTVTIDGITAPESATDKVKSQVQELNGSKTVWANGDDYIVIVGLLDAVTTAAGTITVRRTVPDMDYITEAQNRLWGCKYGYVNGQVVNEIYCCAIGDFRNWQQYLGRASDSYAASVGTDGAWTGAATVNGYPVFFKENHLHKVFISAQGSHQIQDMSCNGIQAGSGDSAVMVGNALYYKGIDGVYIYDGTSPVKAGDIWGDIKYGHAVAGSMGKTYYISMQSRDGWRMFSLDTSKGLWHREDETHALGFGRVGTELYMLDEDGNIWSISGEDGTEEGMVNWFAETGVMGYQVAEQKYISRFGLRMKLPENSCCDLFMEYDSDGRWVHQGHIDGSGTGTFVVPVRPRRCDHFRFRIEGTGPVKVYSLTKYHQVGSDR